VKATVPRTADGQGFRFRAGRVSLDFCSTLLWRHTGPVEQLASPAGLSAWIAEAGLTPAKVTDTQLRQAVQLRESLYRLFTAHLARHAVSAADRGRVNAAAAQPSPAPQLDRRGQLRWVAGEPFAAAMAQLARDAIEVVTGPHAGRLRECAARDCAFLFVDTSRGGQRRWCAMNRCGNREHQRDHRTRQLTGH
jgi:predicted RNA-binding Zn ribbon-like protein